MKYRKVWYNVDMIYIKEDEIILRIISTKVLIDNFSEAAKLLTKEEALKISKYNDFNRMLEEMGSLILIKKFTGPGEIKYNKYNKPYKEGGPYFNVSHSDGLIVLALSSTEIGVDIEKIRTMKNRVIEYALSEKEYKMVETIDDFFKLWTIKESVGKCLGIGLAKGIKNIPTENNKIFMGEKLTSFSFKIESYMGSVTYKGFEPKNVKFIDTKFEELK